MKNYKLPKVPENVSTTFNDICSIMAALCKEKLSDEYFHLGVELAAKIAHKRLSPFLSGHPKTWAAGIIHALGLVNFLFDKSQPVHLHQRNYLNGLTWDKAPLVPKVSLFVRCLISITWIQNGVFPAKCLIIL